MVEKIKNSYSSILQFIVITLCSLYGSLYLELFYESYTKTSRLSEAIKHLAINGALIRFLSVFVLLVGIFMLGKLTVRKHRYILDYIFKYRYLIGGVILVILVIFEINGSSMGFYADLIGYDSNEKTLFGHSRAIRSDEYSVFTPMCISQTFNNFGIYNDFLTAFPENVTMTYGAPSLSAVTIFRPFLWGYILLGASKGLSFFWCARLIVLFLATFEFARILTKDNRTLSVACALLITFSPIVQWWFAINSCVEIIAVGELLCVCLYYMLAFDNKSFIFAILIPWLCGNYLFALYPAWQITGFYVFSTIGIVIIVNYLKDKQFKARTILKRYVVLSGSASVLLFGVVACISLLDGKDAIQATVTSLYPGGRLELGGGCLILLSIDFRLPISP